MDDAGSMLVCRTGRLRALSVCLMILVAQPAIAGTLSGRISGRDDTPQAAKVEVGGTSLSALADADGRYRIDGIPAGQYRLVVSPISGMRRWPTMC